MKFFLSAKLLLGLLVGLLLVAAVTMLAPTRSTAGQTTPLATREAAYRANNRGVAFLEQFNYKDAAGEFRRALSLDAQLALARINLSIALFYDRELAGALAAAQQARTLLPNAPQPAYLLGLIAKEQSRAEDAIAAFQRVLQLDPRDVASNINLGQLYLRQRKYTEAAAALRAAVAVEPYSVTASYNLGLALTRGGQTAEGQQWLQRSQTLRQSNYSTTLGQNYLEAGHYAEAITTTGAEPELVDAATPAVTFTEIAASALPPAMLKGDTPLPAPFGRRLRANDLTAEVKRELAAACSNSATLFDADGDGDLDLIAATPQGLRLLRNDAGQFTDVTAASGLDADKAATLPVAVVAGDYDNDSKPDLCVLRASGLTLFHNEGGAKFSDTTTQTGMPAYPFLAVTAAFLDVDHDGDLDLFITGLADLNAKSSAETPVFPADFARAPNRLLRNNGQGKFADVTAETKGIASIGAALAIVPTDFDNRRDVDLLVVNYGAPPALLSNQRDGSFRDVAADVGLRFTGDASCVSAGDVNKDGFTDFFFGRAEGRGVLALSDGRGRFAVSDAPEETAQTSAAQFVDYDLDGLLDLVCFAQGRLRVLRNLGNRWIDVSERAVKAEANPRLTPRSFAAANLNGKGATDLLVSDTAGGWHYLHSEALPATHSVRVQLTGRVSNRQGVGTKIEARAGSLSQKLESYSATPAPAPADLVFGLGQRATVDVVRLLWPSGNVQAEFYTESGQPPRALNQPPRALTMPVTELDRKPSSCPYLYTWNGTRFEFVTDFMGGGEMGYWLAPGVRNRPDPDEYVRIRGEQLTARDGRYELRVTNELEEALFVDHLQLLALTHPADTEVYPNEGMTDPPRPYKLFVTRAAHPPVSATDEAGHDVCAAIAQRDWRAPDAFQRLSFRGYAKEHMLTLDLGAAAGERTVLLLTGWTDYAFSSDNVAASQAGLRHRPPALQVKDVRGAWQTVIANIGIPVGRPQTIALDLTGRFLSASREVRIVTNMCIYWDQIEFATDAATSAVRTQRLALQTAELRWRGFSAAVGPAPFTYDYARVSRVSPWKVFPGHYTREGEVGALLRRSDDLFVIAQPGDEIALSFDAAKLPPLPPGFKRTFLLYSDGFSKEMDINSASPDELAPLPFHAMKDYPTARYPLTPARRRVLARYNTRVVRAQLPRIESALTESRSANNAATSTQATGRQ